MDHWYEQQPESRRTFNATADVSYRSEGVGAGARAEAIDWLELNTAERVNPTACKGLLEIGCAGGDLLKLAVERGIKRVYGVDIAEATAKMLADYQPPADVDWRIEIQDVSHIPLPFPDDSVHYAFSSETIEHVANPYFMMAEIKRVLDHDGRLVLTFPQPEINLGYGGGDHAHVYPSFLQRAGFEHFMKQLYFKLEARKDNGSSAWYCWRNFKSEGIIDVFAMTSGNYDEADLFRCLEDF